MESQKPSTGKFALTWGLIMGITISTFSAIMYSMDLLLTQQGASTIVGLIIIIVCIVVGIIQFKKANDGFLSIPEAIKIGIGAALISGVISIAFQLILSHVIDPSLIEKTAAISRQAMEETGKYTEEQIQKGLDMQKKFAWITYPIILIFNLFLGFVVAIITGAIMKKSENNF
ncbi:DUF4199 domain-containing protein [Zhouia sp. PK063]|uniref:DUF4199 domain-containing protein n=1 Tax=Zhouia sp. PK063 TaxID=3373602 RepID=UPI0037A12596